MATSLWSLLLVVALAGLGVWLFIRASRASEARQQALRDKLVHRQPWDGDSGTGRGVR